MVKTLTKHGNSLALVIDKPILDLLDMDENTPLKISTDGTYLIIEHADPRRRRRLQAALKGTMEKYARMLKRMGE